MKHIAILCGGQSYEHEVSIITGIQVAESLDLSKYTYSFVFFDKTGVSWLIKDFRKRRDFRTKKRVPVDFVRRQSGVCLQTSGLLNHTIKVDVCYLAFHGGVGESGPVQGMLETLGVPFTSASSEGSTIAMNKSLTKEVLRDNQISVLPSITVFSQAFTQNKEPILARIQKEFELPVIIKPVHLGSSIAIEVVHTPVELEKFLNVATRVDTEILVEPALTDFTEYNVSVRSNNDEVECSPIEEPVRADEILSFDDKYANGAKKSGSKGAAEAGMASLDRTVPAHISDTLAKEITDLAKAVYRATRLSGLVRIDFLYHGSRLYCTEINPIPGSMSFYLWEPTGEQFRDQITLSLEDAMLRHDKKIAIEPYETDIVEKFIGL